MKLNFGRRLVLFVHWLLSLALCALGVALFVWPECRATAAALLGKTDVLIYAIAVLAVYLLFAAGSVAIIFGGRKKRKDGNFIIVDSSETGHARIAVSAVEQMIRQAVRHVPGIAELRASIANGGDAIDVNTDVAILSGAHVPTVTANIQRAIRGYIEQNCGVSVRRVAVSVHSLAEVDQERGRRGRKKKNAVGNREKQTEVGDGGFQTPVGNMPEIDYGRTLESTYPEVSIPEPVSAPEPVVPEGSEPVAEPEIPAAEEAEACAPVTEAAEPAPMEETPAKKSGSFGRIFGKRKSDSEPQADAGAAEIEAEPVLPAEDSEPAADAEWPDEAAEADALADEAAEADGAEEAAAPEDETEDYEPFDAEESTDGGEAGSFDAGESTDGEEAEPRKLDEEI